MLGHRPSQITTVASGRASARSYAPTTETDAYDVGAACLIPYRPLFNAVRYDQARAEDLALVFAVSPDLVEYRIKRSGLSAVYRKHCG